MMESWAPAVMGGLMLYVAVCFGVIAAKHNKNLVLYGTLSVISPVNLVILGYWAFSGAHAWPGIKATVRQEVRAWGA